MDDTEVRITLRLPGSLRDRLLEVADKNSRSMNGEIVARLEWTLIAHPHAYVLRALLDLHEKLLAGKDELEVPHHLQAEIRERASRRGLTPQKFLVSLLLEAINELDEKTELGQEFEKHLIALEQEGSLPDE